MKLLLTILVFFKLKCFEFGELLGRIFKAVFSLMTLKIIASVLLGIVLMFFTVTILTHVGYLILLISKLYEVPEYRFWFMLTDDAELLFWSGFFTLVGLFIIIGTVHFLLPNGKIIKFLKSNWQKAKKIVDEEYYNRKEK